MIDDNKGTRHRSRLGGNRNKRLYQEFEWTDDTSYNDASEKYEDAAWIVEDRASDLKVKKSEDALFGDVDNAHQMKLRGGMERDPERAVGNTVTTKPELTTGHRQTTYQRQRRFPLSVFMVAIVVLLVGSFFLWEQMKRPDRPMAKSPAITTSAEQTFEVSTTALEELRRQRLKFNAQRRLSDPKVAAVFYVKGHDAGEEREIYTLGVTNLKRVYHTADQLRRTLSQESLNKNEKKQLAEGVLDDTILDFGARRGLSANRSSTDVEIERRIERIAVAVQNDRDFEQWISTNYGSREALRNEVERAIVRRDYLGQKSLGKQAAAEVLKSNLEIMWADLP